MKYFCFIPHNLRSLIFILLFTVFYLHTSAQDSGVSSEQNFDSLNTLVQDSVHKDSVAAHTSTQQIHLIKTDTSVASRTDSVAIIIPSQQPGFKKDTVQKIKTVQLKQGNARNVPDRDLVFYILIFLLFFLGLIRVSFPKYFNSIFSLSFQATFRQTQTREQMAQNSIPSFMLNLLFILSGGLFITLFAEFNKWASLPFWQLFVYSTGILAAIYLIKYFVIRFTGWVFNAPDAATEYRFIVFLINKLIGILFIPLLFLIAYADIEVKKISITTALCIAVFLLALRYLVSLARIRKNLSITAFHFFIYLCAVEIMPLLVIYKLLFLQTGNT
jgi:hypothetical protein